MILNLANELLLEIFVYLTPSDIIRSIRKVCRRLHHASREHGVWLNVLSFCDFALPCIDPFASTHDLEKILLRAERIKDVWTGRRPGLPLSVRERTILSSEWFRALIGKYILIDCDSEEPKWAWYSLDNNETPTFRFNLKSNFDESFQVIHGWRAGVRAEINTLYVLYSQTDTLPEGDKHSLNLVSIAAPPSGTFGINLEMSYHVKDGVIFDDMCKLVPPTMFEPTIGRSYVALYPSQILHDMPIHLFNIPTGKLVLCSWHEKCYNCGRFGTERFNTEITPWHFVQIFDGHYLEFYHLPTTAELLQADEPLHALKTHTITLSSNFAKTMTFARSATSYMVLFRDRPRNKFVLFHVHLSPSGAVATLDSEYQIPGNAQSRVAMPDFSPTSQISSSRLGVTTSFAAPGDTPHLYPLWISLKRDFGGEAGPVVVTVPEFVLPSFDYPPFAMYVRYADPFSGRIVTYVADGTYGGDTYKLAVIDYVPLPE